MVAAGERGSLPTTTVIVSAYNQPRWLELLLAALATQTDRDFDVIVADDGSSPPVSEQLDALRADLGLKLACVYQQDDGFRKARIQNMAAAQTGAELLVFLDGDCIPFRDLVARYRQHFQPDEFMVGAVSYLDQETTDRLTPELVRQGVHERSLGRRETLRLWQVHLRNLWHTGGRLARPRIKGGNFAVASQLFRRVDGFDESFSGLSKEDSDLRNRMRNAGARGRSLWHVARASHIWWDRPFGRGRESPSKQLYNEGKLRVRALEGLSSHLRPGPPEG